MMLWLLLNSILDTTWPFYWLPTAQHCLHGDAGRTAYPLSDQAGWMVSLRSMRRGSASRSHSLGDESVNYWTTSQYHYRKG